MAMVSSPVSRQIRTASSLLAYHSRSSGEAFGGWNGLSVQRDWRLSSTWRVLTGLVMAPYLRSSSTRSETEPSS